MTEYYKENAVKFYDACTDELKPVTQEWVDQTCKMHKLLFYRNAIIKKVSNLNIVKDEILINELSKRLGI